MPETPDSKPTTNGSVKLINHQQALDILDRLWDSFDRAAVTWLPVGELAHKLWKNENLELPFLKIAIRKRDLAPSQLAHIKQWLGIDIDVEATKKQVFDIDGIPVHIVVTHKHYSVLDNPQQWVYQKFPEILWLPNPMEELANYKVL